MSDTKVEFKAVGEPLDSHNERTVVLSQHNLSVSQLTNMYVQFAKALGYADSAIIDALKGKVKYMREAK